MALNVDVSPSTIEMYDIISSHVIESNNGSDKDKKRKTVVFYSVDDAPPWYLSFFLGFQVFIIKFQI